MIQKFIMEQLAPSFPDLEWTYDSRSGEETATVYEEGGGQPGQFDVPVRYPRYMVYLSSSDLDYVAYAAYKINEMVPALVGSKVTVEFLKSGEVIDSTNVYIKSIAAVGVPNDLGIQNGKRDFSLNFETQILEY